MRNDHRGGKRELGEGFEEGIRLFDAGRYFECHEVWESAWRNAPPVERAFLKGLTQLAVCLLHAERGNPRGAAALRLRAERHLTPYRPAHATIDLDALLHGISESPLLEGGHAIVANRPRIQRLPPVDPLEVDARGVVS